MRARGWYVALGLGVALAMLEASASLEAQAPDSVRSDSARRAAVRSDSARRVSLAQALNQVVITASRRKERLADAVVATEVIGAEDIARTGATDVAQLLQQRVGMQPSGGINGGVGLALQGFDAQRVLILLDGQPVVGRISGTLDLSRIPLMMVERIEIVKGPQSTLYGSDALGGVVNIVTRAPDASRDALTVGVLGGTQGRVDGTAGLLATRGDWSARLDGGVSSVQLTPGVSGQNGTHTKRYSLSPRVTWQPREALWNLDASALIEDESLRNKSGPRYLFSDNSQTNVRAAWERRFASGRVTPTVSLSRFEHLARAALQPVPFSDSGAIDRQTLLQAEMPMSFFVGRHVVDGGLVFKHEAIEAERVPGGQRSSTSAEPYAQGKLAFGPVQVTTGARVTLHEQWGTNLAPRVALLWKPSEMWQVRLAAGNGYRAPDFKELYLYFVNSSAGYAVEGNPNLQPEHSTTYSATLSGTGNRVSARVGVHHTTYRRFIETGDPDSLGTYHYGNLAHGENAGVEWEGVVLTGRLRWETHYTWLKTHSGTTGGPLLGFAEHSGGAGVSSSLWGVEWDVRAAITGRTPTGRDTTGTLSYRDAYTTLNVGLARTFPWGLEVRLSGDNLLNQEMDGTWPGFTGRRFQLGIQKAWERVR